MKIITSLLSMLLLLALFPAAHAQNKVDSLRFSLYFDVGKYDLRPESEKVLADLAEKMKYQPKYEIYIQGNTDDKGTEEANVSLSNKRCTRVQSELLVKGIAFESFKKVEGLGENYPIAPNITEESRQQNRRVDMLVLYNFPLPPTSMSVTPALLPSLSSDISTIIAQAQPTENKEDTEEPSQKADKKRPKIEEDTMNFGAYLRSLSFIKQEFGIKNKTENIIETKDGILIHFPENAFDISDVDAEIAVEVQEFTQKGNMVLAGLFTSTTSNALLESGGMINLAARRNGKNVHLRSGKKISVYFPHKINRRKGMNAFYSADRGTSWKLIDDVSNPKITLSNYVGAWGVPANSPNELKNLHATYCDVCDKNIHYEGKKIEPKAFMLFGVKLFSYKPWGSEAAERKNEENYITEEKERRKEVMAQTSFKDCPQMREKLIGDIQKSANFDAWFLNIFPNWKQYYSLMKKTEDYHAFSGINLGWTNCDRYLGTEPSLLTKLDIEEQATEKKVIRIALKEDNVTVPANAAVPINKPLYIIGIKRVDKKLYLAINETISDKELKHLEWEEVSDKELVERLNHLNG